MKRGVGVVAVLVAVVTLFSCGDGEEPSVTSGPVGRYTGRIEGTAALVGITVGNANIVAWVCDGDGGTALQFTTPRVGDGFDVTLPIGARIAGSITATQVRGALGVGAGAPHAFEADLAEGNAGVWTVSDTVGGEERRRVWVVLNDGAQQGATLTLSAVTSAPRLDTGTGTVDGTRATLSNPDSSTVSGFGGFSGGQIGRTGLQFGFGG